MSKKTYIDCLPADFWKKTLRQCRNESCLDAYAMLARGFWSCENNNHNGKILLTGINPSYDGRFIDPEKMIEKTPFELLARLDKPRGFWKRKEKQFGELWNNDTMSYLDLFPIRESDQAFFERAFEKLSDVRGAMLEVTQDAIEELRPKLIIHANHSSMYYWGINENTPWMGYKLERVDSDIPQFFNTDLFPLFIITGLVDHKERINNKRQNTNLVGSFLMSYVMDDRNNKYKGKLYSQKEWKDIWAWVVDHKK